VKEKVCTVPGTLKRQSLGWLVPRGSTIFLIGMSGAADGTDVAEAEFAAALASIQIER
jgi:hypothetical protein